MSGGAELPSSSAMEVDGKKQRKKITFNLKGQIIQGKNEFKARGLELLKTHIGLAFDDWRHVPDKKKEDMFETLLSVEKRKPDRVELYVDARKNPKTKLCHPGAVSDVGMNPSSNPESGASHTRTNAEVGVIPIVHCSEKSATGSPSTPTSGPSKSYKLMNLDGSKSIAQVTIVKTVPGSLVHGRPLLPFEVKIAVVKVFPGMGDEPLWKGNQGGADTLAETEGGYLVWPKYLMEEVTGDNSVVIVKEPVDCPNVSVIACKYASIFQDCLQHSGLLIWNRLNNTGFWRQLTGQRKKEKGFNIRGVNQMDKTLSVRGARISFSLWEVAGGDSSHDHISLACKDSVAMIFMFDLTSRCTLNRKWNQAAFIRIKLLYFPETLLHGRKDDELKIFERFDGPIMKGYIVLFLKILAGLPVMIVEVFAKVAGVPVSQR
ncbi:hypothetical protein LguiA_021751 [Lonicera macranthoides]